MTLRQVNQGALELQDVVEDGTNLVAQVEPYIQGDLIVAAAGGVELAANGANRLDQAPLDVHVDVLPAHIKRERAALDFRLDRLQAVYNGAGLLVGDNAALGQHPAVRDTAQNIVGIEPPIEQNRGGEVFDEVMRGLVEAASPGFGLHGAAVSPLQASRHERVLASRNCHTVTRPLRFVND